MFNVEALIRSVGYIGVVAMVFAENGLLVGFFLPGDSLLFTAGFLASQGFFNPWILALLAVVSSIAGTQVGYAFGHRWGRGLFRRPNSRFFKQENLQATEQFYEKHGRSTIILARFVPVVRTFAPIVAGIGQMNPAAFLVYNVVGGVLWAGGVTLLGFWLGGFVPSIDRYLLPIIAVIIVLSILPGILHMLRDPIRRRSILDWVFRRNRTPKP